MEVDIDEVQHKLITVTGFSGLLLGLVVNVICGIKLNEFNTSVAILLKNIFLVVTYCLVMCIVYGFTSYFDAKNKFTKNEAKQTLKITGMFLLIATVLLALSIPLIITKSINSSIIFMGLIPITIACIDCIAKIKKITIKLFPVNKESSKPWWKFR